MNRFSDIHNEPDSTPLRRDAHFRVRLKADGRREEQMLDGKEVSTSADGSIDCATVTVELFYHCGDPVSEPIGGQCGEPGCRNISCRACFIQSRCSRCLKPLCLEHVQQLSGPKGAITLCGGCKTNLVRQHCWQAVFRAVLKPFVDFDGHD